METLKKIRQRIDYGEPIDSFIGQSVKIGFMVLEITGYQLTPKDGLPNIWLLTNSKNDYEFTPHYGLQRKD